MGSLVGKLGCGSWVGVGYPINPCGAGYPWSTGSISMGDTNAACNQDPKRGFCCDGYQRISLKSGYQAWKVSVAYRPFETITAILNAVPEYIQTASMCKFHSPTYHNSVAGSGLGSGNPTPPACYCAGCGSGSPWNLTPPFPQGCDPNIWNSNANCGNEPAVGYEAGPWTILYDLSYPGYVLPDGSAGYRGCWERKWTQCKDTMPLLTPGCTNPHSFGIVTEQVLIDGNGNNSGSPGSISPCTKNCMQLSPDYYDIVTQGEDQAYASNKKQQLLMGGFNRDAIYDCEPQKQNPLLDADDIVLISERVQGPKLIYAGRHNSSCAYVNSTFNGYTFGNGDIGDYDGWRGYLWKPTSPANVAAGTPQQAPNWNQDNAHGQALLTGGPLVTHTDSNTKHHLWRRRSEWKTNSTGTYTNDFDNCCQYVTFGCTDSSFGSYNQNAQLNCDGIPKTNIASATTTGHVCFDVDGNDVYSNPYTSTNPNLCYDESISCGDCINPTTEGYYDSNGDPTWNPNSLDYNTACTEKIWNACGGSGYISSQGWTRMANNTALSDLYDDGGIFNKSGQLWGGTDWDTWGNDKDKPICSCNNAGCMHPDADNYNALNVLDCGGFEPTDPSNPIINATGQPSGPTTPNPFGDVRCCQIEANGCIETTSDNYFCKIDTYPPAGIPDNVEHCMVPGTGVPCWDGVTYNPDCASATPTGGVPLGNPTLTLGQQTNNITVNLQDDGACDINIQGGCMDNGNNSTISPFGVSALNYDPDATLHIPESCAYALACMESFASNFEETCDGTPINDLYGAYPEIVPGTINDYIISSPQCCEFTIPGTGPGCTDPNAINFNPLATVPCPDDCCEYPIEGCTDPNAINFQIDAVLDDGSCIYSTDFPEEGTNFLDGTSIELCMDPLTKEEVLMNVCQPTEIQSEVFIERGTQTVFEPNQRLGEINTIGGLEIYGYGFYNIKKQI